jgi:glycosyltransferase involved in cell wall biosynthesis
VVVDAHNEAVEPYINTGKVIAWLSLRCIRNSDLTIVTNHELAKVVLQVGGRAIVLPDKIPDYAGVVAACRSEPLSIVMIAAFTVDEPIEEFLLAVQEGHPELGVSITGRSERLHKEVRSIAGSNVRFTGYLEESEFWSLLANTNAVVDLTRKDNCLVCGAYEGIAVGKPLILSDSRATRAHFRKGALYVDNTVSSISDALRALNQDWYRLQKEAGELRDELRLEWREQATRLVEALCGLVRK